MSRVYLSTAPPCVMKPSRAGTNGPASYIFVRRGICHRRGRCSIVRRALCLGSSGRTSVVRAGASLSAPSRSGARGASMRVNEVPAKDVNSNQRVEVYNASPHRVTVSLVASKCVLEVRPRASGLLTSSPVSAPQPVVSALAGDEEAIARRHVHVVTRRLLIQDKVIRNPEPCFPLS